MARITLKHQREKSLLRMHPWVFSGAIQTIEATPASGETVDLHDADGQWLARGAYSPASQISVRLWTFDPNLTVDAAFFQARLDAAIQARTRLTHTARTNARRLVNAESDRLPGLIVDQYGEYLVCQFLSAGVERWKAEIVKGLTQILNPAGIFERSDTDSREKEGLPPATGTLSGNEPPELIEIHEGTHRYLVDVRAGHKTGFYLDQRDNRALLAEYAGGTDILNAFSFTGAFAVPALAAGANRITNVDTSGPSLAHGRRHIEINQLDPNAVEDIEGDVFQVLRRFRDSRRQFDLIILDPPKFADSRGHVERACRGYKDINLLAFKLLRPGGVLFTFSCSGQVSHELFQQIVAGAALDSGRPAQLVRQMAQAADHPVALCFPEGSYLKGMVCRV